jgi:hypothetical protein
MAEMTQFRQEIAASEKGNVAALGVISTALETALVLEREQAEEERMKLTDEIVSLVSTMIEGQQARWSSTVDHVRTDLASSQNRVQGGYQLVSKGLDTWAEREGVFSKTMLVNKDDVKKSIVEAAKVPLLGTYLTQIADKRGSAIQESARRVHAQTIELVDTQMKGLDEKTQALDDFVIKGMLIYYNTNSSTWSCRVKISTARRMPLRRGRYFPQQRNFAPRKCRPDPKIHLPQLQCVRHEFSCAIDGSARIRIKVLRGRAQSQKESP